MTVFSPYAKFNLPKCFGEEIMPVVLGCATQYNKPGKSTYIQTCRENNLSFNDTLGILGTSKCNVMKFCWHPIEGGSSIDM